MADWSDPQMPNQTSLEIGQTIQAGSGAEYRILQYVDGDPNSDMYLGCGVDGDNRGVLCAIRVYFNFGDIKRRDNFLAKSPHLKSINHPCLMNVFDTGSITVGPASKRTHRPYIITDYLPQRLYDEIRRHELSNSERVSFALDLIAAVRYLSSRERPLIHRDIRPQNIFIKGKSCVLGEYGLLLTPDCDDEIDGQALTDTYENGTSSYYRTPDLVLHAHGEQRVTEKSDVFQLGLVLTELYTGWNPVRRTKKPLSPVVLYSLKQIPGGFSGGIATLLKRMLVLNPSDREPIDAFLDAWQDLFNDITASVYKLEGRSI